MSLLNHLERDGLQIEKQVLIGRSWPLCACFMAARTYVSGCCTLCILVIEPDMVFNKLLRELKLMQGELLGMGERILGSFIPQASINQLTDGLVASIEREGANTDISGVREQILGMSTAVTYNSD